MKRNISYNGLSLLVATAALFSAVAPAQAQDKKPNILFIMGDDIGWMQPSCYHRGLMVGETPNIDRIANEGGDLHGLLRRAELHRRAQRLLHRHASAAHGHDPAAVARQPVLSAARHAGLAKFLLDLGYNTGEFGKNHLGDHTDALPTAHGFQEFWGYLYHLDAMQEVSFPDINKTPDRAGHRAAVQEHADPRPRRTARRGRSRRRHLPDAAAPGDLVQVPRRHGQEPDVQGRRPADAGAVEDRGRGDLGQRHRLPRSQRPQEDQQAVLRLVQPGAHAHHDDAFARSTMDMLGAKGGKDWGINEAGMKQMDDNIGYVLKKLEDMGELDNTIIVFTTDNGAEVITFPDGGVTPFKGGKLTTWEGGMRAPCVVRWPGAHQAGHGQEGNVRVPRLAADVRRNRRRPQGQRAEEADRRRANTRASSRPRSMASTSSTTLTGKSEKVGARHLLLLLRAATLRGALQELEVLLHDGARHGHGRLDGRPDRFTGPSREHHARPVRDAGRRRRQDAR